MEKTLILRRWLELMVLANEGNSELLAFVPAHYFTGELPLRNSVRFIDVLGRKQLWMDHDVYGISDLFIQETI